MSPAKLAALNIQKTCMANGWSAGKVWMTTCRALETNAFEPLAIEVGLLKAFG